MPAGERRQATGAATVSGKAATLGGAEAFTTATAPIPVRRYLLWVVLVVGALTLLRRLGKD